MIKMGTQIAEFEKKLMEWGLTVKSISEFKTERVNYIITVSKNEEINVDLVKSLFDVFQFFRIEDSSLGKRYMVSFVRD